MIVFWDVRSLSGDLGIEFHNIILSGICAEALRNTKIFNILVHCEEYYNVVYKLFKLNVNSNNKIIIPDEHYKERKIVVVIEGNLINVKIILMILIKAL